jgi:hypothetical protein
MSSHTRGRLIAAVIGGGAIAIMGTFTIAHGGIAPTPGKITSDSGDETKFPPYSSPVVPAMTTQAINMSMGATTTSIAPQSLLATSKAVPAITPAP